MKILLFFFGVLIATTAFAGSDCKYLNDDMASDNGTPIRWIYVSTEDIAAPTATQKEDSAASPQSKIASQSIFIPSANPNKSLKFFANKDFKPMPLMNGTKCDASKGMFSFPWAIPSSLQSFDPVGNPDREIWKKGDYVNVVYIIHNADANCPVPDPESAFSKFTESDRNSVIADQLKYSLLTLAGGQKITAAPPAAPGGTPVPTACSYVNSYSLVQDRANLNILIDSAMQKDKSVSNVSGTFVTGPQESVFLSLDLLPNAVSQLQYDSTNKVVVDKGKSGLAYIGINYQLGDILTNYSGLDTHNLVLKGMVEASSTPQNSYGIGIGYIFKTGILGTSKDIPFSGFIGAFDTAPIGSGASRKVSWRLGISYNIGMPPSTPSASASAKTKPSAN